MTASQLTDIPSMDTTIEELEDVLQRRLTVPEIQVSVTGGLFHNLSSL